METSSITKKQDVTPLYHVPNSPVLLVNTSVLRDVKGSAPLKQWTQEDQSETDKQQREAAESDLVQTWMQRLQLISVITTFFATTEVQLLGFTAPAEGQKTSSVQDAANTVLAGAFIVHLSAAIISFLAAFFLIRFRLREVAEEELQIESHGSTKQPPPASLKLHTGIWTTNPHLVQYGPFRGGPPTRLLEHCHTLCMWFALIGFALALSGGLCFAWDHLPRSAGIFASVCLGLCWTAGAGAVFSVL